MKNDEFKRPKLGDYPCKFCLVKAACQSLECKLVNKYLTYYYLNLGLLTADEIRSFRDSVQLQIRRIMDKFNGDHYYACEHSFYINDKKYLMSLEKDRFNILPTRIEISEL